MMDKIKKLFVGGEWNVAYRIKEKNEFQTILLPKGFWAADPILFDYNGHHYLFAEIYETKKKKAGIGYFEFENDIPIFKGIIIENNYHMSYPCVFQIEDEFYMIPESSSNHSVDLYRAIKFPDKWVKEKTLLDNCEYVDSTVFNLNDDYYVLAYTKNKSNWSLDIFRLDKDKLLLIKKNRVLYELNVGRPAGKILQQKNFNLRPAQDSSKKYGENVIFYKISSFEPYSEEEFKMLTPSDLNLDKKAKRVHTYSENERFVVIDYFVEKFELFHVLDIYKRSHFKKKK